VGLNACFFPTGLHINRASKFDVIKISGNPVTEPRRRKHIYKFSPVFFRFFFPVRFVGEVIINNYKKS